MTADKKTIENQEVSLAPLFDRVLLKPIEEKALASGIYVPRDLTERSLTMIIVAAGDGINEDNSRIEMVVKAGDRVLVSKYTGTEVVLDNEKFWIVRQCDILAKILK